MMSALKKLLPNNWFKKKESSGDMPEKDDDGNKKSWIETIHHFNDNVAQIVIFNSKLLVFLMLLFFVYLLFASVFQGETFSINQINVHPTLVSKGYNSTFIAKKISYKITTMVNQVPQKLFYMFGAGEEKEKNEMLYKRILGKYVKKEIKIDMDVNVGGVNLPLRDLTKTARSLFNVEDKSLDGDITVDGDLVVMTLGFNSNGINKSYKTIKRHFEPKDTTKMFDVVENLTNESAKFVLSQYDPLVTLLMDYNPFDDYSSGIKQWKGTTYSEEQRFQILKQMSLNESNDRELAIWAHAITGALYTDKYTRLKLPEYQKKARQHFEKAVEMDPSFIDIVGLDLANIYSQNSSQNEEIRIYREMINSDPGNLNIHRKLLEIYSGENNKDAYYKELEKAFENGLYIPEDDFTKLQYRAFKDEKRFKGLVAKYNERNNTFD